MTIRINNLRTFDATCGGRAMCGSDSPCQRTSSGPLLPPGPPRKNISFVYVVQMSMLTSESSSRCICRAGYHCSCSRPEVVSRPYVSALRPKFTNLASNLMRVRTDAELVKKAVVELAVDDEKKCCGLKCIGGLVLKYDLQPVVDAIMAARRGVLCGDQIQKTERLRAILNEDYDPETRVQHFFFHNKGTLSSRDGSTMAPDRIKVRARPCDRGSCVCLLRFDVHILGVCGQSVFARITLVVSSLQTRS